MNAYGKKELIKKERNVKQVAAAKSTVKVSSSYSWLLHVFSGYLFTSSLLYVACVNNCLLRSIFTMSVHELQHLHQQQQSAEKYSFENTCVVK